MIEHGLAGYNKALADYLSMQLLLTALKLDLFSLLDTPRSVAEVAELLDCHPRNTLWFLRALHSEGFIQRAETRVSEEVEEGEKHPGQNKALEALAARDDEPGQNYVNTELSSSLLSRKGACEMGTSLLQRLDMSSLPKLLGLLRTGPPESGEAFADKCHEVFAFKRMAEAAAKQIHCYRAKPILECIGRYFRPDEEFSFMDLGGGSGAMALEVVKAFPKAEGHVFEQGEVAAFAREYVPGTLAKWNENDEKAAGLKEPQIIEGNFVFDEIGGGYDLIIASGIFHFAKNDLAAFLEKVRRALNPGGKLLSLTYTVSDDYAEPPGLMNAWLMGHCRGVEALLKASEFGAALKAAGFCLADPKLPGGKKEIAEGMGCGGKHPQIFMIMD